MSSQNQNPYHDAMIENAKRSFADLQQGQENFANRCLAASRSVNDLGTKLQKLKRKPIYRKVLSQYFKEWKRKRL